MLTPAATPFRLSLNPAYRFLPRITRHCADVARRCGVAFLTFIFSPLIALYRVEQIDGRWCKPCRDVHAKWVRCPRPRITGYCCDCGRRRGLTELGLCPNGHSSIAHRKFFYPKLTGRPSLPPSQTDSRNVSVKRPGFKQQQDIERSNTNG